MEELAHVVTNCRPCLLHLLACFSGKQGSDFGACDQLLTFPYLESQTVGPSSINHILLLSVWHACLCESGFNKRYCLAAMLYLLGRFCLKCYNWESSWRFKVSGTEL